MPDKMDGTILKAIKIGGSPERKEPSYVDFKYRTNTNFFIELFCKIYLIHN